MKMLDPGTAVAVAGLAFDVAKDILKYLKAWKRCPKEMEELWSATLWLSQTFYLVRKTLQSHGSARHDLDEVQFRTIITEVENCSSKVEALRTKLQTLQTEISRTLLEKFANQAKRLKYPFSEGTVKSMLKSIQDCEGHLHFTVTLLNLGTTARVLDEVRSLDQTVTTLDQAKEAFLTREFGFLKNKLSQQVSQVQSISQRMDNDVIRKDHEEALLWLLPADRRKAISRFHTSQYRDKELGAGSWFLDGTIFEQWQGDPNSCLWLHGPVGCGKSVLCSAVIHELQTRCYIREDSRSGDILMYFYFSHRDESFRSLEEMLRSCIAQIGSEESLSSLVTEFCQTYHSNLLPTDPSNREYSDFLFMLLEQVSSAESEKIYEEDEARTASPRQIFIVLDALDEVPFGPRRDEVHDFIQSLRQLQLDHVHLLLTSRDEQDIQASLEEADNDSDENDDDSDKDEDSEERDGNASDDTNGETHPGDRFHHYNREDQSGPDDTYRRGRHRRTRVSSASQQTTITSLPLTISIIGACDISHDIEIVVREELRKHRRLKKLTSEHQRLIIKRLAQQQNPMFRWAALQMTALKETKGLDEMTTAELTKILEALPSDLDKTYQRKLDSVTEKYYDLVHNALRWLVYARRPLHIDELVEVCAFNERPSLDFDETRRKSPQVLQSVLIDFIVIESLAFGPESLDSSQHLVSLAHFSVKEFLVNKETQVSKTSVYNMDASLSHRFIAKCCLVYLMHCNVESKRGQNYALRDYAWNCWAWHSVRSKCPDGSADNREEHFREAISYPGFASTTDTDQFMSNMLWALIDWNSADDSTKLLKSLSLPYFYEESSRQINESLSVTTENRPWLAYRFERFRDANVELRLVDLLPSKDEFSELRCKLYHVDSIKSRNFEVFTYMWNSTVKGALIRVNGLPVHIPTGLAPALRRLRSLQRDRVRTLWIDSLSIDQENRIEKEPMVRRMAEIFRHATASAIFADSSAESYIGSAIQILKQIDEFQTSGNEIQTYDLKKLRELAPPEVSAEHAVMALFGRRIWSRLWPLQEMVIPNEGTMFFGDHQISTNVLERVLFHHESTRCLLRRLSEESAQDFFAKNRGWQSAIEMAGLRSEIRLQGGVPVLRALYASRYLSAYSPHDRLYGILGLMHAGTSRNVTAEASKLNLDGKDPPKRTLAPGWSLFTMDYTMDVEHVYTNLAVSILGKYQNLDMFSFLSHEVPWDWRPLSDERDPSLPSWVSTFRVGEQEVQPLLTNSFIYPVMEDPFAACYDRTLVRFELEVTGSLLLRGYEIDTIEHASPPLEAATFACAVAQRAPVFSHPEFSETKYSARLPSGQTPMEAYWRTVTADQSSIGIRWPSELPGDNKFPPKRQEDEGRLAPDAGGDTGLRFSEGRSFILTAKGHMGLGPTATLHGDIVAIFPGGKVAYVLRPHLTGYHLIGDCYIHGIMDGEAMKEMKDKDLQEFHIF